MQRVEINLLPAAAPGGNMPSTCWAVVLEAQAHADEALNTLFASYRQPLLVWLRRQKLSSHDAEDILHSFFAALLKRSFLDDVGQEKGRFRNFLLVSLRHHLCDHLKKLNAPIRGGGQDVLSLDKPNARGVTGHDVIPGGRTPDQEFDRIWAHTVLENALHRLDLECSDQKHGVLYDALQPTLLGDAEAVRYREIGESLGLAEGTVRIAAFRIRKRLRRLVRNEVRQTVLADALLEDELDYLMGLFGRP